ncbi:MAG TPA: chemotaxis protein CheB [Actinomycetota bacterium]|nr:chemotaxis protein CheB [Actinomycetota bacterium]
MATHNSLPPIVGIGASAGGITPLRQILGALDASLPAAILIVQHMDPNHTSVLADILRRSTSLSVDQATQGAAIEPGHVLLAPPDHHLLATAEGTVVLSQEPRVHFVRPSVDVLFTSMAAVSSRRAVGVVLSGGGLDGATGVRAIRAAGGIVIAQNEATSEVFGMPGSAIETGDVGLVLSLDDIPAAIEKVVLERVDGN